MNCIEFEDSIDLLVGDGMIDDVSRQRALNHVSVCSNCSLRFSDERIISAGLSTLAEDTSREQASPAVKAALMQSFAQLHSENTTAVSDLTTDNVVAFPARRIPRRAVMTLAVAASILALIGLAYQVWSPAFNSGNEEIIAIVEPEVTPPPTLTGATPDDRTATEAPAIEPGTETGKSAPAPGRRKPAIKAETAKSNADFIPLTWVSDTASLQSGTVVRVEVERATLLAMGLPVNAARSDSLIKADLVVGDDGIARAIRFVQ